MTNPTLERAARAAAKADATLHNGPDLYEANPELYLRLTRAVLMAVLSGVKRVHTDGYNWREGGNGPFVIYDDLEAILADGAE